MILQALFFTTAFWKPCFLFLQFWNVEIEGLIMLGLMSSVSCSFDLWSFVFPGLCGSKWYVCCMFPLGQVHAGI